MFCVYIHTNTYVRMYTYKCATEGAPSRRPQELQTEAWNDDISCKNEMQSVFLIFVGQ